MTAFSKTDHPIIQEMHSLNAKYPEYSNFVICDHVTSPSHHMEGCRAYAQQKLFVCLDQCLEDVTERIHMAEEEDASSLKYSLLQMRKSARQLYDLNFNDCSTVEQIEAKVPEILKPYWNNRKNPNGRRREA